MRQIDVVLINANAQQKIYQGLANKWAAIEPPTWSLLLAGACIAKGKEAAILDCIAENLNKEQAAERIKEINPRLVCFVTYGQNPNSGTTQMTGTVEFASYLREVYPEYKIMSIGSHSSALPHEVIASYHCFDFVAINEGVKALIKLLGTNLEEDLYKIHGLVWKDENGDIHTNLGTNSIVKEEELEFWMPSYPWHLLPYKNKPLDLYRSHNWLTCYQEEPRTPYAAIYTSLGCRFQCNFCLINIVNREDIVNSNVHAGHSNTMRYWPPSLILKWFEELIEKYSCTTIRISDEMYYLNKKYYEPILQGLIDRGYGDIIRTWTYARIDSVNERFLDLFKRAGVKFLGLGIEAARQEIRLEITKGKFKDVNIRDVCRSIQDHGLYCGNNFIFGHDSERLEDMQASYDLACELNGEFTNFYTAMALPGSALYFESLERGYKLPDTFEGYSFHSYECQPLPTKYLKPEEVLRFRDEAWQNYHKRPEYLNMIEAKFGSEARANIEEQTKIKLKRKILEQC